jgi:hypothetical protein
MLSNALLCKKGQLPCHPGNPAFWVFSRPPLSSLVGEEDPETKSNWQEKVFDWDGRRVDCLRKTRDIEEDENDDKCEKNGREEP